MTRTPTKPQTQVLFAVMNEDKLGAGSGTGTMRIHGWLAQMAAKAEPPVKVTQPETFTKLRQCVSHGWLQTVTEATPFDNAGSHLSWTATDETADALARGMAAHQRPKEDTVAPTTTEAPPASTAAWGNKPADDAPASDADLQELDEAADGDDGTQDGGEGEIVDEEHEADAVERHVVEGSNQLSLKIGGAKPVSSILKVKSKQQKFGSTREFKMGELIEVTAVLRIDSVLVKQEATGHVARVQTAVFDSFAIDGTELEGE